jgi:elongation factor P hydroxylase
MDFRWSVAVCQPDKQFNEQRKVFRKAIGPQTASLFDQLLNSEAERLVKSVYGFSGDPSIKIDT